VVSALLQSTGAASCLDGASRRQTCSHAGHGQVSPKSWRERIAPRPRDVSGHATNETCTPVALLVLIGVLVVEVPVDAYLDPGSGSMLLQVVLGGFAAIGVMAKLYWHRLTSILRREERDRDRR